jgi:hypothetical protein
MLAFLFAVVSLTNIDPEAIVTPAPIVRGTTNAGSGFAPGDANLPSGLTADIAVAPVCTFGMPRFGSDLWGDASALSRTLAPQCAGMTSPFGAAGFGAGGSSPYGFAPYGYAPYGYAMPWFGETSSVVRLTEPAGARSKIDVPTTFVRFPTTPAIRALPQPVLHEGPAEPALLRARAVNRTPSARSH